MKNEIILSFGISGFEDISHEELTSLIGITPDIIFITDKNAETDAQKRKRQNTWIMSPGKSQYTPFDEQLNYFLDIMESKMDIFRKLCAKYYCEFSCAVTAYTGNDENIPKVHLNSRYNELIKELNIAFDIELHCWPDNE